MKYYITIIYIQLETITVNWNIKESRTDPYKSCKSRRGRMELL